MTYDQAQSPRLGQRVPVESTYVQMFLGTDIPEAAWSGQLIYRVETQGLEIYDDDAGAWKEITGGTFGMLTFVGGHSPPPVSAHAGDIWFDTDDGHHQYRAATDGAAAIAPGEWESVQDGEIAAQQVNIDATQGQVDSLTGSVTDVADTASSAQSTANTADGRVTMSDYDPTIDDATDRNDGSLWYTRTRNRANMVDNPSFELNTTSWTSLAAVLSTVSATPVPDVKGLWAAQINNNGTTGSHGVLWSSAARQSCPEGTPVTASVYADLISGSGTGVTVQIVWFDGSGSQLSTTIGDPITLQVGSWLRPFVSDIAPPGTASFYVQVLSPTPSDVWQIDGALVEMSDELGRYFDGYSYDSSWDDPAHPNNITSTMDGDKIIAIYELYEGDWVQKYLTSATLYGLDQAAVVGTAITANTLPTSADAVGVVLASEALVAGNLVNVWSDNGLFKVRRATSVAGTSYPAHGFVLDSVASGALVHVYYTGLNTALSGMSPGVQYLSALGAVTSQPSVATGAVVQRVGFATAANMLSFSVLTPVLVTP